MGACGPLRSLTVVSCPSWAPCLHEEDERGDDEESERWWSGAGAPDSNVAGVGRSCIEAYFLVVVAWHRPCARLGLIPARREIEACRANRQGNVLALGSE
jgi:hypothetical protein